MSTDVVGRPATPVLENPSVLDARNAAIRTATVFGLNVGEWELICQHFGPVWADNKVDFWKAVKDFITRYASDYTEKERPYRIRLYYNADYLMQYCRRLPACGNDNVRYP